MCLSCSTTLREGRFTETHQWDHFGMNDPIFSSLFLEILNVSGASAVFGKGSCWIIGEQSAGFSAPQQEGHEKFGSIDEPLVLGEPPPGKNLYLNRSVCFRACYLHIADMPPFWEPQTPHDSAQLFERDGKSPNLTTKELRYNCRFAVSKTRQFFVPVAPAFACTCWTSGLASSEDCCTLPTSPETRTSKALVDTTAPKGCRAALLQGPCKETDIRLPSWRMGCFRAPRRGGKRPLESGPSRICANGFFSGRSGASMRTGANLRFALHSAPRQLFLVLRSHRRI